MASCNLDNNIEIPDIDENITACGVHQPQRNLPWLSELIRKAETDSTGNYRGTVWLVQYEGRDIFVTNMMLGSGGVANWFFDCSGNHFIHRDGEGQYCPSEYVGDGHVFFEDEEELFSYISTLRFDVENKNVYVIYSTLPLSGL
jgi:hypothetical protein